MIHGVPSSTSNSASTSSHVITTGSRQRSLGAYHTYQLARVTPEHVNVEEKDGRQRFVLRGRREGRWSE